jgi:hypothetical protein
MAVGAKKEQADITSPCSPNILHAKIHMRNFNPETSKIADAE